MEPGIIIILIGLILFVIGMIFREPKIQPDNTFVDEYRKEISDYNDVLIPLINKKDGSAITFFLNHAIDKEQEGMITNELHHCNTLFNLFKFFTLKRTPSSLTSNAYAKSGNFLEDLTMRYSHDHDCAKTEIPNEVNDYISNGQMESELNEEHFEILKDEIHRLCVLEIEGHVYFHDYCYLQDSYLTYILYSKNNPKMAAIQLKVDDSELDILYKEFSQLLNEDELNTLYENAEKYRTEESEELVEKVNKERTKRLDDENYSVDDLAYSMLASNYALDESIAVRLKGKALIQEVLDQKIAVDIEDDIEDDDDWDWRK
jgi:hypothetical protein